MVPENQGKREASIFVAGLPSQVDHKAVVAFFRQFTPHVSLSRSLEPSRIDRLASKGCCVLDFRDSQEAQRILQLNYFEFMGRTLTLSPFKSGVDLVIQNKKLKKCRVQLKKVPWYLKEEDLKALLEDKFGPVYLIFQLRNEDPRKSQYSKSHDQRKKHYTYSVYFLRSHDAKKVFETGKIKLEDGSSILVKRTHLNKNQTKRASEEESLKEEGLKQEDQRRFQNTIENRQSLAPKHIKPANTARESLQPLNCHWIKPTHKDYYTMGNLGAWRVKNVLDKSRTDIRLNRESRLLN